MEALDQVLVSGILLGGQYALVGIGVNFLFGVARLINFAHGEFLMLGMYGVFLLFAGLHVDPFLSILIVAPAVFFLGWWAQKIVIQPLLKTSVLMQLVATVGLMYILQSLVALSFGDTARSLRTDYSGLSFQVSDVYISATSLIGFGIAAGITVGLYVFLRISMIGKAIRASAEDKEAAETLGIDVKQTLCLAFGLAAAIAAIAGITFSPSRTIFPQVGSGYLLLAFIVVVLGGMGNLPGTFVAGLIIGVVEVSSGYFIGTSWKEIAYLGIFVIMLLFRPAGLFGRKGVEVALE